ncbi:MAG: transporter, partial [Planctomycetota bacterium]
MLRKFLASILLMFFSAVTSFAAHPLVTDDTGTQGKGKFQMEINSEFTYEKEAETGVTKKETGSQVAVALSYG